MAAAAADPMEGDADAGVVTPRSFTLEGRVVTLHVVRMPERSRSPALVTWLISIELDRLLFGGEVSSGRIYKLLSALSMLNTQLQLSKAAVSKGAVTQEEFEQLLAVLPSRSARKLNLIPLPVAVAMLKSMGDGDRVRGILVGLGQQAQIPRVWDLRREQQANKEEHLEDLLLNDELEELEANEMAEVSLVEELCTTHEEYAVVEEDEADARSYALKPSKDLEKDFSAFEAYKLESLNRMRRGPACVDSTFANTKGSTLRFMGWFKSYGPNACPLRLEALFGHTSLGEWIEAFCRWLQGRGCKSSTLSNYLSGLLNTLNYVLCTVEVEETSGLSTADQLLNLRQQCDSQARVDSLYARRHPAFIPWPDVQATRIAATKAWEAVLSTATQEAKRKALLELLCVLWFSVSPPDRCGVVRRLRFGHTLKKDASDTWTIDLTRFRHKTSKVRFPAPCSFKPSDRV